MWKKLLLLFPLFSCTILELVPDGSQRIQVRIWENRTPNFLVKNQMHLDVAGENVVDFDVLFQDDVVYLAYTTDSRSAQTLEPVAGSTGIPITTPPIAPPVTGLDEILYIRETEGTVENVAQKQIIQRRRIRTSPTAPWITNAETVAASTTVNNVGVWLRLLKGRRVSVGNNVGYTWEQLYVSPTTLNITNVKVADLAGVDGAVSMVTNDNGAQRVVVLYNTGNLANTKPVFEFLDQNLLFAGGTASRILDLNTWRVENNTFFAARFDNQIRTGIVFGTGTRAWETKDIFAPSVPINNFQVQSGRYNIYAVFTTDQRAQILRFDENNIPSRRWQLIDSISSVKFPKFAITEYKGVNNEPREIAYLGTVNETRNFFLLQGMTENQLTPIGPIITGWNERYVFAPNNRNQVLYARVQDNNILIFAGLNALGQWEPIQITSPPPVSVHPNSQMEMFFQQGQYPITIFKQANGSVYLLEGVS